MSDLMVRGPLPGGSGSPSPFTASPLGAQRVNDAHGRFFQAAFEERLFSGGMTVTSINNATFTTATLGATCTPIAGVWNPKSNTKYLSILQATLQVVLTALQNTGGGPFMWATSFDNGALTLGSIPLNRKTLIKSGSAAKDLAGIALTGLSNNLVVAHAAGIAGGNAFNIASLDTAAGFSTLLAAAVENIDGAIIVPPGGVLALLATTTPVAQSAASGLLWEEIPILA